MGTTDVAIPPKKRAPRKVTEIPIVEPEDLVGVFQGSQCLRVREAVLLYRRVVGICKRGSHVCRSSAALTPAFCQGAFFTNDTKTIPDFVFPADFVRCLVLDIQI